MLIRLLGQEKTALSGTWSHPFTDVSNWAQKYVGYAYETGLTTGQSATTFGGKDPVSARDYITFVLRALGYTSGTDFAWATAYQMSDSLGFTSGEYNASSVIDRGNMVLISYKALGVKAKGTDTTLLASLLSKGVVSQSAITEAGADSLLTGLATTTTSAAESSTTLNGSAIYKKCSSAVFYIEVYNSAGTAEASGSGFFITGDGVALTCYHVIDDTASAKVTTTDGSVYSVTHVLYYDEARDIAVIRVSKTASSGSSVSAFPYLTLGDVSAVSVGDAAYALGSPLGLTDTFTDGIISSTNRVVDGQSFIQTSASISKGSSGGVLLNAKGEAIGVTSATYEDGQNLNLAIPVSCISAVDLTQTGSTYASIQQKEHPSSSATTSSSSGSGTTGSGYYVDFSDVPDFGARVGIRTCQVQNGRDAVVYYYLGTDVTAAGYGQTWATTYNSLLTSAGFRYMGTQKGSNYTEYVYRSATSGRSVCFGLTASGSATYVFVLVEK
jgi:hypothetical protein